MSFDIEKFRTAKFKFNESEIKIDELKGFFNKDEKAVFKVRNLTGHELAKVNEAAKLNENLNELILGLMSKNSKEKIDAIKEGMGITDNTPEDLVRRISMMEFGMLEPEFTQTDCVKFADAFPYPFAIITNKILELTGKGKTLGE